MAGTDDPAADPGPERASRDGRDGPSSRRESLLWGVVGALSFLVAVQGYELLTDTPVGLAVKAGVAVAVGAVAAVATYALASRIPAGTENESS